MSQEILVIGESGSGKSTSFEELDPTSTFIINVANKPFPFRGWKAKYSPISKENPDGNYLSTDDPKKIVNMLHHIDKSMPHIKIVIIDDFQYIMANEFMRRANERGFEKFTDIGLHAWEIINTGKSMKDDVTFVVLGHAEASSDLHGNRKLKFKTIGKLVDEKINIEGMFTVVLFTDVSPDVDGKIQRYFVTQSDGTTTAKSPRGMFEDLKITNNLDYVIKTVNEYNS